MIMRSDYITVALITFALFSTRTIAQEISYDQQHVAGAAYFPCSADEFPKDKFAYEPEQKVPGATIYSTGFANSLGSWTTSGTDGALWLHDDDGPNGQFAVTANEIIGSQSVNNGFAIFDADLSNPGGGPWADRIGQLVSPVIDMTGISFSFIEFWHKYRFCCDNAFIPRVEVTTTDFVTYATFDASIPGVEPNSVSPSYKAKINISSFLDTASNLNNFRFRFNFDGSNGGSHYYWQIDDVKVRECFEYDLFNKSVSFSMGEMGQAYYFVSESQLSPMIFSAELRNDGSMPATGCQLSVSSNAGSGVAVSPLSDLQPGEMATFTTPPTTMFSDTNSYLMTYDLLQDSVDAIPQDNKLNHLITVHRKLYSIDDNQPTGYIANISPQSGQAFKVGNVMEIMNNDLIDSMYVFVTATSTNVGQVIFGEVRKRQNGNWVLLGTTGLKAITMQNNGGSIGLAFTSPLVVSSGDTLLVLACHNGGSPDVRFRITRKVGEGTVQGYRADGTNFVLSDPHAVMVRLGMTEVVGLNTLDRNNIKLYPNPLTDLLYITVPDGMAPLAEVIIADVSGKHFRRSAISINGNTYEIDMSDLESGIYVVSVPGAAHNWMRVIKL
jgi:hypothetical protein